MIVALSAALAAAAPTAFDQYELVVLKRGPSWSPEVTPEVEALQAQHLAHLDAMAQTGLLVVAGPLSDQPDAAWRGICLYRTGSLEHARAIAEADPAVQAGRLQVEVMTWWTEKGALDFPLAPPVPHGQADAHADGHAPADGHANAHAHAHDAHDDATVHHRFDDPERWAARFDDPARDAWQKPAELVAALDIPRGATVADVGAGTGYLMPHLAKAVGKKGKVLAVDIEPALVAHLGRRALREKLLQVEPRVGRPEDPGLAPDEADVVVVLDVYHHIDDRVAWLTGLREGVRPGGRLVVVDYHPDREGPQGPPAAMRLAPEQVEAEAAKAGWKPVGAPDLLPYQYVRIFTEIE